MIDVSVIIITYNSQNYIEECLKSLLSQKKIGLEIIVVDNNSSDNTVSILKRGFPELKLILNQKNSGFAIACNQGIKISQGKYLFLLNPDTFAGKDTCRKLFEFMEENAKVGISGPRILSGNGKLYHSARRFPGYFTAFSGSRSFLNRFFPHNLFSRRYLQKDKDYSQAFETDWVSGSALWVRKKMLEEIGLLDERFFLYVEDVDLCWRAQKKNWKVTYFPGAQVTHFLSRSKTSRRFLTLIEHHKSMFYFYRKYYSDFFILQIFVFYLIFVRLYLLCVLESFR